MASETCTIVFMVQYIGKCCYEPASYLSYFLALVGFSPSATKPVTAGPAWNVRHPQHDKVLAWDQTVQTS
jgi:hypothetical protein